MALFDVRQRGGGGRSRGAGGGREGWEGAPLSPPWLHRCLAPPVRIGEPMATGCLRNSTPEKINWLSPSAQMASDTVAESRQHGSGRPYHYHDTRGGVPVTASERPRREAARRTGE